MHLCEIVDVPSYMERSEAFALRRLLLKVLLFLLRAGDTACKLSSANIFFHVLGSCSGFRLYKEPASFSLLNPRKGTYMVPILFKLDYFITSFGLAYPAGKNGDRLPYDVVNAGCETGSIPTLPSLSSSVTLPETVEID